MSELDTLLATNNIAAEKIAMHLSKELSGHGLDALLNDLEQAIDALDYPVARTILGALVKRYHLSGPARGQEA